MAKSERLIYCRRRWEIANVRANTVTGRDQWERRDGSYICNVGSEDAVQDMPKPPPSKARNPHWPSHVVEKIETEACFVMADGSTIETTVKQIVDPGRPKGAADQRYEAIVRDLSGKKHSPPVFLVVVSDVSLESARRKIEGDYPARAYEIISLFVPKVEK